MKRIKLFDPVAGLEEERAIKKVLRSHFWASGAGIGKVLEFENKFNRYIGSSDCVAVSNGTAALHLALSLVNIKNKKVILPSISFVSTAHAVVYNGGIPVFVDIDPHTLCLDPSEVERTVDKNTVIILPVHFGGMPCDLAKIMNVCKENGVHLIEDAAHASGALYNKKKIGTHGIAVCFSFHPVKNLAMPTGGAITLNGAYSAKFSETIRIRRWCGISHRKGPKYDVTDLGWNYYMNEFSAAIGLEQLKRLDKSNFKRKKIAKRYSKEIILAAKMPFNENCSYHLYWIQVKNRDYFMRKMNENGIETGIHYLPIHKMSFYRKATKLPITEQVGRRIVSIPIYPNLTHDDVDRIIKLTNKFGK